MQHVLVCLVVSLLVSLTACTGSSPKSVNIDESSSGEEIVLPMNGTLKIALNANGLLGYSWDEEFAIDNESVITQTNYVYKDNVTPSIATQLWTFTAVGSGTATITNDYGGFNIPAKSRRTFTLSIVVK